MELNVLDLPDEQQRQLFDAFQLEIRYDRHRQQVTLKVAIRADMIDSIGKTATDLAGPDRVVPRPRRSNTETDSRGHVVRGPADRRIEVDPDVVLRLLVGQNARPRSPHHSCHHPSGGVPFSMAGRVTMLVWDGA